MKVITLLKIVLGLCFIDGTRNCLCGVNLWMLHNKAYQCYRQNSLSLRMLSFSISILSATRRTRFASNIALFSEK